LYKNLVIVGGGFAGTKTAQIPGLKGVWAVGDCAAVTNASDQKVCPPTAQFAEAQARQLVANIVSHLAGRPTHPFQFRPKGQLSSVGHNKAVAEVLGFKVSGFIAWLMWRGLYLLRIPTLARKTRLFLEWNWAMFFPPDISHLGYRRTQRRRAAALTIPETRRARWPKRELLSLERTHRLRGTPDDYRMRRPQISHSITGEYKWKSLVDRSYLPHSSY
jgi:hypothetical protein